MPGCVPHSLAWVEASSQKAKIGRISVFNKTENIAEHSVEGCDHFSHDGDDDDLGFFVGVGEALVEGLKGGTVSTCAEGGM